MAINSSGDVRAAKAVIRTSIVSVFIVHYRKDGYICNNVANITIFTVPCALFIQSSQTTPLVYTVFRRTRPFKFRISPLILPAIVVVLHLFCCVVPVLLSLLLSAGSVLYLVRMNTYLLIVQYLLLIYFGVTLLLSWTGIRRLNALTKELALLLGLCISAYSIAKSHTAMSAPGTYALQTLENRKHLRVARLEPVDRLRLEEWREMLTPIKGVRAQKTGMEGSYLLIYFHSGKTGVAEIVSFLQKKGRPVKVVSHGAPSVYTGSETAVTGE